MGAVRTARLDLVPATLAHLDTELEAPAGLGPLLGAAVPDGWPPGQYDVDAMRFFRDRLREEGDGSVGWYAWYALLRDAGGRAPVLVAGGGYFGPPADGVVEIGYSVVPAYRGRGLAAELADALAARALARPGMQRVVAHTDEGNPASQAVLRRAGFRLVGAGAAPGELRFERGPAA